MVRGVPSMCIRMTGDPDSAGHPQIAGIEPQGTYVVYYVRARCKRLEGHFGLIGIYRYRDVAAFTHCPDDWNYPLQFHRQRDRGLIRVLSILLQRPGCRARRN